MVALKSGNTVMLRPARVSDVHAMQLMFHRMSQEDVYTRFFRRVSALSYDEAQRLCNVDFDKDVAFVAVTAGACKSASRTSRSPTVCVASSPRCSRPIWRC